MYAVKTLFFFSIPTKSNNININNDNNQRREYESRRPSFDITPFIMPSYLLFKVAYIISKGNKLVKNYVNYIKFVNRAIDQANNNIDLLSRKHIQINLGIHIFIVF